jgi:serine/threonine-protein kinase
VQAADEVALIGGKYLLLQELGRGGMGVVYEAENIRLGKHVALKAMREELRFNPRDRRKFLEEARNLAKLEHPNVVGILDVLEEPSQDTWLVMELVRGRSLKDRLDVEERIAFAQAQPILAEVLKALDYVHRKKVVHRDLKPGNIMLGDEGQTKVMDFGIARQVKDLVTRTTGADSSGTMAYMGPEQHLGAFDPRTDLFAFGVVFYETLCGELPFQAGDLLLAKKMRRYRPLSELGVQLPPAAWGLIQACLEPEPDDRPADAADVLRRLGRV